MTKIASTQEIDVMIDSMIKTKVSNHSCQLFEKGGDYGYKPYGSAVCVKISNSYFILTASHVTDELSDNDTLYVKGNNRFIAVEGNVRSTDIGKEKQLDLAYVKLDLNVAEALKENHQFLTIDKIKGRHKLMDASNYAVVGYPEKNIRVVDNMVETGGSYYLTKPSAPKVYAYHKINPDLVISLNFSGEATDMQTGEKQKRSSDPYGMSGCGIWLIDLLKAGSQISIDYFLIGLLYGGKKNKYHVLLGNRIDILLEGMNHFGDVNIRLKR